MLQRIIIVCLLAAVLCAAGWLYYRPASPAAAIARSLSGERWYTLSLGDRRLGYWHTDNRRDSDGNWVFESEQRFALNRLEPVSTVVRRTFSGRPPHPLLFAEHLQIRRDLTSGVRIESAAGGYRSIRLPEDGVAPRTLDWAYTLTDYLGFELWLVEHEPGPGATKSVTTLDFEKAAPVNRSFDVVDHNPSGYLIENAAPLAATRIQLDAKFAPFMVDIAGLFSLTRSSREAALSPRSTLQSASYYVPTDRRLSDHTRIARLVLGIAGDAAPDRLFEGTEYRDDRWQLTLRANTASTVGRGEDHLEETLNLPVTHPRIAALTEQALGHEQDPSAKARALTHFVHRFLRYRPGAPPRDILSLLEIREGDCTEFADLLTTLARSAGLPGRTVFGLAYADGHSPAFAYHAWNELFIDGAWMAVDPTWDQLRVDATHIPLPDDERASLELLTGAVDLTFSVLEVEHFTD